jgi:hypothetical protein
MISFVIRVESDVINELIAYSRWSRRPKSRARQGGPAESLTD